MEQNNQLQEQLGNEPLIRNLPDRSLEHFRLIYMMFGGENLRNQNIPHLFLRNAICWTAFCAYTVGRLPWSQEGTVALQNVIALYNQAINELMHAPR